MGSKTIIADREDIEAVESEEQLFFVFSVLQSSGIPEEKLESCFSDGFSVENKIALRKLCDKEQISIIKDVNGSLKIYIQNNLIAEWHTPTYILHVNKNAAEHSKKMFMEMRITWWTFEEGENDDTKNKHPS